MVATRLVFGDVKTLHLTASQFLDKPFHASMRVVCDCSCEFAAISRYIRNGTR